MRNGLDDLRYVTLLNQLVNQAKNPQSKAVQDAKAVLAEIKALDPDLRNYTTSAIDAKATGISDVSKMWTPEACERMRWRIAESIMALQK
jgi:hypothetical protein